LRAFRKEGEGGGGSQQPLGICHLSWAVCSRCLIDLLARDVPVQSRTCLVVGCWLADLLTRLWGCEVRAVVGFGFNKKDQNAQSAAQ
jgi:hypothetical protein